MPWWYRTGAVNLDLSRRLLRQLPDMSLVWCCPLTGIKRQFPLINISTFLSLSSRFTSQLLDKLFWWKMSSIAIYSRRATTAWALKPYSLRATICCQATTVYGRSIQLPYRFYSGNNASNTTAKTQRYPHIQQGTALLGGVLLLAWISYNTFDNEDKRHLHENRPKYATRRGMDRV